MGVVVGANGRRGRGESCRMTARRRGVVAAVIASVIATACGDRRGSQVTVVDLIKQAARAERRPAGADFPVLEQTCGGTTMAGQGVPVPSRLIFTLKFPARARLVTAAALEGTEGSAAEFRIGVSDRRTYETLMARRVSTGSCRDGWVPIDIDLGLYAGRQWSVFYRPDERSWELILGVTTQEGTPMRAVWGMPRIESDSQAAKAYRERRLP